MSGAAARSTRRSQAQAPAARGWVSWVVSLTTASMVLAGLLYGYDFLSQPGRLPLRVIEVQGEFRQLERARIERIVVNNIDGGFFSCDMQKLRTAIREMPWVEDVSIRRVWPDKLSMRVTEQVPVARWGEDALVNVNAQVFRPARVDGYRQLVQLSGPDGSPRRVVDFFQAVVPAARLRDLQIREIELDARGHWWIGFDNDLTLSLGQEQLEYRLAQFFRVYPKLVQEDGRQPARVDMRYAHGFAVRWHDRPAVDTASQQNKAGEKA